MSRWIKFIFKIGFLMGAALVLLAAAAFFFPQKFLCVEDGETKADVIIVLGGGAHERPERAAELFGERAAPRVIVSGAGDCEINRRLLIEAGVPAAAIQLEDKSATTRENARFVARLLRAQKIHRAIVVTSWYHSRRALATFRHYAPGMVFYSRPSYFAFNRSDWPRGLEKRVYLEYAKLAGYWVRYGVCPF